VREVLGAVHRLCSQRGEGWFVPSDILWTRGSGVFRARRLHILVQKLRIFRNLWCVRTDKGEGVSQCGHLQTWGDGGQIFAILCGRFLWTAPYREVE